MLWWWETLWLYCTRLLRVRRLLCEESLLGRKCIPIERIHFPLLFLSRKFIFLAVSCAFSSYFSIYSSCILAIFVVNFWLFLSLCIFGYFQKIWYVCKELFLKNFKTIETFIYLNSAILLTLHDLREYVDANQNLFWKVLDLRTASCKIQKLALCKESRNVHQYGLLHFWFFERDILSSLPLFRARCGLATLTSAFQKRNMS
jgi:hypothetical protein